MHSLMKKCIDTDFCHKMGIFNSTLFIREHHLVQFWYYFLYSILRLPIYKYTTALPILEKVMICVIDILYAKPTLSFTLLKFMPFDIPEPFTMVRYNGHMSMTQSILIEKLKKENTTFACISLWSKWVTIESLYSYCNVMYFH